MDVSAAAISWSFFVQNWSVLLDSGTLLIVRWFASFQLKHDWSTSVTLEQMSVYLQPTTISSQSTSKNLARSNWFLLQSNSTANDLEPADSLIVSYFRCGVASAPETLWLFRKMQITSGKEIDENKRTIFEKIKMFSRCAIYLHKAFYLGHLLVSNFFLPLSRSCCKHFSCKVKSVWANMTVIPTMGREGGGKKLPDLH